MSRKGCPNKIHSGIYYPRKCDICDYVSNNASMFHYHKKTHLSVEGKLCNYGCGQDAKFVSTKEVYCCSNSHMRCPAVKKEFSEKVADQWKKPESKQRKEDTKLSLISRLHNEKNRDMISNTKRIKTGILTEEKRKLYRRYAYCCRKLSQQWAKNNGYEIGRQTFHVDHIYSVLDGFKNEISPNIISHPANLRILEAKKNSSKGCKSEITIEELLRLVENN